MSKYNAKKVVIDNITFDSKIESKYYLYLKEKKKNKEIKDFELQPKFLLQEGFKDFEGINVRPIYYIGDFKIINNDNSVEVVDIKGMATPEAKLKRKLFMYRYPEIRFFWICYVVKRGGWIDYFDNEKLKRKDKKGGVNE